MTTEGNSALFSAQLKPAGGACSLRCEYCYYRPDAHGAGRREWMSEETLTEALRQYVAQPASHLTIGWHGGEPLLRGIDFFEQAFGLATSLAETGQHVGHALQTNGILIDAAWARLFAGNDILVGVSIDGPEAAHDTVRPNAGGGGSRSSAETAIHRLLDAGADVNALCVVSRANVERPVETYESLLATGVRHIQFIPCWIRKSGTARKAHTPKVGDVGRFLNTVFDLWAERDLGKVFVQNFEQALASSLGQVPDLCIMAPSCSNNLVIEHDGSVHTCDWFTQPKGKLGNLHDTPIAELVATKRMQRFSAVKARLPQSCDECRWLDRCNGGCPAHRVQANAPRPTWFCRDNKIFFEHTEPTLHRIAAKLGLVPADAC